MSDAEWKGSVSESLVNKELSKLPDKYIVFNDLLFMNNGRSTQIDHVVVSPYGVFVIETKGYKGWIFGGENSEFWTQVIYHEKYKFYNPLKQNESHINYLTGLLKFSLFPINFIPIVVFNNDATIKAYAADDNDVINRRDLLSTIYKYKENTLTPDNIEYIIDKIRSHASKNSLENKRKHKNYVEKQRNKNTW